MQACSPTNYALLTPAASRTPQPPRFGASSRQRRTLAQHRCPTCSTARTSSALANTPESRHATAAATDCQGALHAGRRGGQLLRKTEGVPLVCWLARQPSNAQPLNAGLACNSWRAKASLQGVNHQTTQATVAAGPRHPASSMRAPDARHEDANVGCTSRVQRRHRLLAPGGAALGGACCRGWREALRAGRTQQGAARAPAGLHSEHAVQEGRSSRAGPALGGECRPKSANPRRGQSSPEWGSTRARSRSPPVCCRVAPALPGRRMAAWNSASTAGRSSRA